MNLEEALKSYGDFKAGRQVHWKLRPYLEMLDEGDHVGAYLIGTISRRDEHRFLKGFTKERSSSGIRIGMISSDPGEIGKWIKDFVDAMFVRFLELNRYCPFCSVQGGGNNGGSPYPLSSKACPHRELEALEEEEEG